MRKVFFSFAWDDVWRVNQVRNSWVTKCSYQNAGFMDKAEIEKLKLQTNKAIENWIDNQMHGTSVTCILIGENTHKSKWVKYEIERSLEKGNGLIGILINELKDNKGNTTNQGANPLLDYSNDSVNKKIKRTLLSGGVVYGLSRLLFPQFTIPITILSASLSFLKNDDYKIYDWIDEYGRDNLSDWIEKAAKQVNR
jgi:hypothetical protein